MKNPGFKFKQTYAHLPGVFFHQGAAGARPAT